MAAPKQQSIFKIASKPGIKRDGTRLEGENYIDGRWCRFNRGFPRKMWGYKELRKDFTGPARGAYAFSSGGYTDVHCMTASGIEMISVDQNGGSSGIQTRTPAGFTTQSDYIWQSDTMYDAAGSSAVCIMHPGRNLNAIDNDVQTPVYYGDVRSSTALVSTGQSVSGGCVVLHPFLFLYDNDGYILWSQENQPTQFAGGSSGNARVAGTKIVKGLVARGGTGYSPSGIFWALDSVIRASYVGGSAIFRFDTVSDQSSILSSSSPIEYDGVFFWIGVDRFYVYNGVVRELPNSMNLDWFFSGLNWQYRQKVWAMKVPRWGEIWWFYPRGSNTECSDAIIYNVREDTWYDAGSAAGARRSFGISPGLFPQPLCFAADAYSTGKYSLHQHEFGVDYVDDVGTVAIQSYFETNAVAFPTQGPNGMQWMGVEGTTRVMRFEPDFVMSGEMNMTVRGGAFANSTDIVSDPPYSFTQSTEKVDLKEQRRLMRFRFESNVAGGDYLMGEPLLTLEYGDGRP